MFTLSVFFSVQCYRNGVDDVWSGFLFSFDTSNLNCCVVVLSVSASKKRFDSGFWAFLIHLEAINRNTNRLRMKCKFRDDSMNEKSLCRFYFYPAYIKNSGITRKSRQINDKHATWNRKKRFSFFFSAPQNHRTSRSKESSKQEDDDAKLVYVVEIVLLVFGGQNERNFIQISSDESIVCFAF